MADRHEEHDNYTSPTNHHNVLLKRNKPVRGCWAGFPSHVSEPACLPPSPVIAQVMPHIEFLPSA